ncbi:D-alanyl-D-alanine carboxypeptidase family protein [Kribbella deserti]|uniref:D-alanyl-D-alanine carboxypeptidase family protein n=1 Tax=Kribbella deserti TaxID=1926257 RepID=A0ABV6QHD6_9ACTN
MRSVLKTGAAAVAITALGVSGWLVARPGDDGAVLWSAGQPAGGAAGGNVAASNLLLPWPKDGQSAVEVEGVGSLGARGDREPVPIASLAKVMTAYVILKHHPLKDDDAGPGIEIDQTAENESASRDESTAKVRAGRSYSERELLELMLIPSGNNIARLLARWDAGSQEAFVQKMNEAAHDLGMDQTKYTGASGFEPSTVSTAVDQLKLAREVMKSSVIRSIVAKRSVTLPGIKGEIVNTNALLDEPGVVGLKTGSSTPAGGALMWAAKALDGSGRLIIGVVLHQHPDTTPAEGRRTVFNTSKKLLAGVQEALAAGKVH